LAAVNQHPRPALLLKLLNVLQGYKYVEIAEATKTQEKFVASWFSRVALVLVAAGLLSSCATYPPTVARAISRKGAANYAPRPVQRRHF